MWVEYNALGMMLSPEGEFGAQSPGGGVSGLLLHMSLRSGVFS